MKITVLISPPERSITPLFLIDSTWNTLASGVMFLHAALTPSSASSRYFTQMIIMPQGCNTSLLLATQEHNGIIINGRSRIEGCPDMEKWADLSLYKAFKYAE